MSSIKITLYSDEGPAPTITSIASGLNDAAQIEWSALVGTAAHLLRNHREQLSATRQAALETFLAASKESAS